LIKASCRHGFECGRQQRLILLPDLIALKRDRQIARPKVFHLEDQWSAIGAERFARLFDKFEERLAISKLDEGRLKAR
jgi:hypothetical protein